MSKDIFTASNYDSSYCWHWKVLPKALRYEWFQGLQKPKVNCSIILCLKIITHSYWLFKWDFLKSLDFSTLYYQIWSWGFQTINKCYYIPLICKRTTISFQYQTGQLKINQDIIEKGIYWGRKQDNYQISQQKQLEIIKSTRNNFCEVFMQVPCKII